MKTILSHFYNEEYLLPWWLSHHKKYFEHGIMINYASTDKSVEIIKEMCPSWDIVDSRNNFFDSEEINREVEDYERNIKGWRICLNTTEFIIGNFDTLDESDQKIDILIPSYIMVDNEKTEFGYPDPQKDLIEQRTNGATYKNSDNFNFKMARRMSNHMSPYPPGRHFHEYTTNSIVILWYGFSPMNDSLLNRKIQIQNKIPQHDISMGNGIHHVTDKNQQIEKFRYWQNRSIDLKEDIYKLRGL